MKLSDLMKEGAIGTEPITETYFNSDFTAACAMGCAILGAEKANLLGEYKTLFWADTKVFELIGYSPTDIDIDVLALPLDIATTLFNAGYKSKTVTLYEIIICVNDYLSRERAIEVTRELGY